MMNQLCLQTAFTVLTLISAVTVNIGHADQRPSETARHDARLSSWESHARKAREAIAARNLRQATTHLSAALKLARTFPQPDRKLLASLNNMAIIRGKQGQFATAELLLKEALQVSVTLHGETHASTAECLFNLAMAHLRSGNINQAIAATERGAAIAAKSTNGSGPDFAVCFTQAAQQFARKGDAARTERALSRAVSFTRQQFGSGHPRVAMRLASIATLYRSQGRLEAAENALTEGRTILEKHQPIQRRALAIVLNNLANNHRDQKQFKKADQLLQKSAELLEEELGPHHEQVAGARMNLAIVADSLGNHKRAHALMQQALPVFREKLGPLHPTTRDCERQLQRIAALLPKREESPNPIQRTSAIIRPIPSSAATATIQVLAEFEVASKGRPLLVPVVIASREHLFLLDTGTEMTIFDWSLKSSLKRTGASVRVVTPDGSHSLDLFEPPTLTLGSLPVAKPDRVACANLTKLKQVTGQPIVGVLGMDVLQNLVLQIDFDSGHVRILAASDSRGAAHKISYVNRRVPAIDVALPDGATEPFIIDSGLNSSATFRKQTFGRLESGGFVTQTSSTHAATAGGTRKMRSGVVRSITIGQVQHESVRVVETGHNLLGLGMLSRYVVTLDFPAQRLFLRRGLRFRTAEQADLSGLHLLAIDGQVVVALVDKASEAERQGLKEGDVIVAIDTISGKPKWLFALRESLATPSSELTVILRRGGRSETTSLRLVSPTTK